MILGIIIGVVLGILIAVTVIALYGLMVASSKQSRQDELNQLKSEYEKFHSNTK